MWKATEGYVQLEPFTRTMSGMTLADTRTSKRVDTGQLVVWIGEKLMELEGGNFIVSEEQIVAVKIDE